MAATSKGVDPELVEAIARRVAELLVGADLPEPSRLVDAAAVARELGVERDWVYNHARQLGGVRLGGPRGRLRFDLAVVRERLGGAEPDAWRPPRRPARRAKLTSKALRRELKSRSRTAKVAGRRANAARPDTGR
jgi:hypothetical protein